MEIREVGPISSEQKSNFRKLKKTNLHIPRNEEWIGGNHQGEMESLHGSKIGTENEILSSYNTRKLT